LRTVFDNNVAVSSVISPWSSSARALEKAIEQDTVLVSAQTMRELEEVIKRVKFDRYAKLSSRRALLRRLAERGEAVVIGVSIRACRDPQDNMILELAVSGKADCIVTRDKDLLVLDPFQDIRIVTPEAFLEMP
jgi:putative PIN family toxin of toxin-antitoxin system